MNCVKKLTAALLLSLPSLAQAGEADIRIPDLAKTTFLQGALTGHQILWLGLVVCALATAYGWWQYLQTRALPVHRSMAAVSDIIWETCKTYLWQQGKFLAGLWVLIAGCMTYYFAGLEHKDAGSVAVILAASVLGILGSYGVAWFGIRINTVANSRAAFSALGGNPLATLLIPLKSGMSVGLLLVAIELFFMIGILLFLPKDLAGPCFIGFAIGESLGASALRICGGIFTKIADIGADLMKIDFKLPEDDPRNPGVIADCTGDNAGDSVGPTADGFETYGVTGVALISFVLLAVREPQVQVQLLVWLFMMRIVMVLASGLYRRVAQRMRGYDDAQARQIFRDLIDMPATVKVTPKQVTVTFHRRAHLPLVMASSLFAETPAVPWWGGAKLVFQAAQG